MDEETVEDLFYYSPADIQLEDISLCLGDMFRSSLVLVEDDRDLIVYFPNNSFCRWWERLSEDELLLEDEEKEPFEQLHAVSAFLLTYHPSDLAQVISVLRQVLSCYQGYVGCNGWNANYTIDTIEKLECL